jgi:XTP/dITP diphosphohydrolase
MLTLADDSGLEVDALGGLPGIRSARFAPQPGATDADRRAYLLAQLEDQPRPWSAHFHCTVALAMPSGGLRLAEGNCYGEVIPTERGDHGFGYDPIFLLPDLGRTMAELTTEEKNRFSHRARAVRAVLPLLTEMIRTSEQDRSL